MKKKLQPFIGAFKYGEYPVPKVDMVIEGSVAVDSNGGCLGKSGGYGDIILFDEALIDLITPIVST